MPKKDLIRRCESIQSHVLNREWADEKEIAEFWPKHSDRARAWEDCFGHLRFIQGRAEGSTGRLGDADAVALKALTDEPVTLQLTDLTQVSVFPKSFRALMWFHQHDFAIAVLADREDMLREMIAKNLPEKNEVEDIWQLIDMIVDELTAQMATVCYAATMPGVSVDKELAERPPGEFTDMHPVDMARIHRAFWDANVMRIGVLPYLVAPKRSEKAEEGTKRMSWSVFGSEMANVFKVDVNEILNNRSLPSLLAQVQLGGKTLGGGLL